MAIEFQHFKYLLALIKTPPSNKLSQNIPSPPPYQSLSFQCCSPATHRRTVSENWLIILKANLNDEFFQGHIYT